MKILFLSKRFYPEIGGVERHVLEVSKELIKKGNEVTVVCEGKGDEVFEGINVKRISVTAGGKIKKFLIWYWFLKNLSLIREAEIIHCHDIFFWILPFRFLFPFKKIYTTFHGWEGIFPIPKKNIWLRKIYEKLSNGNICVGDYLKKWYKTKTDFVTYGGVENYGYHQQKKNLKVPLICFLGRLENDTGLPVYLEAMKKIEEFSKGKIAYIFIGDGSLRGKATALGHVTGFVKDPLKYIIDSSFVFTSSYLFSLEAMYFKKKVFSVYDNPLKEDISKMTPFSEWIDIEKDALALAEKTFVFLKKTEKFNTTIDKAYQWAREQTWEKVANLYLKLWGINN